MRSATFGTEIWIRNQTDRKVKDLTVETFEAYGKYLKLRSTVIFGGVGQAPQVEALKKGVDILIACPGRLNDLRCV